MRIVFVGGGTGGHFYPLIAIAEIVRERDQQNQTRTELYYMGPDPYNMDSLARLNIKHITCPAGKQRKYKSILNFLDLFKIIAGIFVGFWKLLILYPDVIMSKGGYTSVPVTIAAHLLRIPIVIHESDAVPGKANVLAAKYARYIGIAHDDVVSYFPKNKVALVGMPVRKSFFAQRPNPHELLNIPNDRPVILIAGGSLGAERVNNLILEALDELLPLYTLVHQAGESNATNIQEAAEKLITNKNLLSHYYVLGHMPAEQFAAAQDASRLIISRAGSGTIFEIALKGKPSILIPIPEDISHDQRANAYAYAHSGAASVMEEKNLSDSLLVAEIKRILEKPGVYAEMSTAAKNFTQPDAAYTLADTLIEIGKEHE